MDYRKYEKPEIEDWEDSSDFRSEEERQLFLGFGFGCCASSIHILSKNGVVNGSI